MADEEDKKPASPSQGGEEKPSTSPKGKVREVPEDVLRKILE